MLVVDTYRRNDSRPSTGPERVVEGSKVKQSIECIRENEKFWPKYYLSFDLKKDRKLFYVIALFKLFTSVVKTFNK